MKIYYYEYNMTLGHRTSVDCNLLHLSNSIQIGKKSVSISKKKVRKLKHTYVYVLWNLKENVEYSIKTFSKYGIWSFAQYKSLSLKFKSLVN